MAKMLPRSPNAPFALCRTHLLDSDRNVSLMNDKRCQGRHANNDSRR